MQVYEETSHALKRKEKIGLTEIFEFWIFEFLNLHWNFTEIIAVKPDSV